jgi:hypothetical protein
MFSLGNTLTVFVNNLPFTVMFKPSRYDTGLLDFDPTA